jgi:hypothetical protein
MIAITAVLLICIILPFLPGDFDAFASQLSLVVQTFSIVGLVTCFPAAVLLYHAVKSRRENNPVSSLDRQRKNAKIYVYTFLIAFLPVALMAMLTLSLSMGIGLFFILVISARSVLRKIERTDSEILVNLPLPLFLMLLPILLLAFQLAIYKPLTDWSKNKAIIKSKELIDEIENCKLTHGKYPLSLNAVHKDYNTGIIGIEKYHYSYRDTTYDLYFEQPKFLIDRFGAREFVVYNPNDSHLMISHASWNARWGPTQIRATQGWFDSGNIEHPHWKYFLFD